MWWGLTGDVHSQRGSAATEMRIWFFLRLQWSSKEFDEGGDLYPLESSNVPVYSLSPSEQVWRGECAGDNRR